MVRGLAILCHGSGGDIRGEIQNLATDEQEEDNKILDAAFRFRERLCAMGTHQR